MDEETILILLVLIIVVGNIMFLTWWLPQKWQACTKLYDNVPAQIICVNTR